MHTDHSQLELHTQECFERGKQNRRLFQMQFGFESWGAAEHFFAATWPSMGPNEEQHGMSVCNQYMASLWRVKQDTNQRELAAWWAVSEASMSRLDNSLHRYSHAVTPTLTPNHCWCDAGSLTNGPRSLALPGGVMCGCPLTITSKTAHLRVSESVTWITMYLLGIVLIF